MGNKGNSLSKQNYVDLPEKNYIDLGVIDKPITGEEEGTDIFERIDLSQKISPEYLHCKTWKKPGIASY